MNKIFLIRHGQSTANVDEQVYLQVFDHNIPLTGLGKKQSEKAGKELLKCLKQKDVNVFYSPYKRTTQTWHSIQKELTGVSLKSAEENPLLREQEHKFFKNMIDSKEKKEEQKEFGIFWYRFKNAESIADVHQRITIFMNNMMLRQLSGQLSENIVIVAHEITIKVLLLLLLKKPISDLDKVSVGNCEIIRLESDDKLNFKLV
jgi:broad specificity phosphatase PhoE